MSALPEPGRIESPQPAGGGPPARLREIPYNYTSLADREIVIRLLGDPCHSPMKKHDPLTVVNTLMNSALNGPVTKNDRCCGESGTLALARPDISTQVRFRKEEEVLSGVERLRADGHRGEIKVLTSCPSCLQGLKRYKDDADLDADYIVVEIAKHLLGADWLPDYVRRANAGGIERVLV